MIENFGYVPDYEAIETYAASLNSVGYASDVAQLMATDDGNDAFLWRPLVYCLSRCSAQVQQQWLYQNGKWTSQRSYNQGNIGSCVGNGEAEVLSVELAIDIIEGNAPMELIAMASAEACYALGREAGNMLGNQDGSFGAAAAKGSTTMGTLWQIQYPSVDLTTYSVSRCKEWGRTGVPAALKPTAAEYKLRESYQVKSTEEAWALIGAGHPINQCSNLGFAQKRDSDGACKQTGQWAHSMALIGRRTTSSGRKLFICINSWGEDWVSGPVYKDQPQGSFGIDYEIVGKAIAGGDCFVKVGMTGIKRRQLDWSNW